MSIVQEEEEEEEEEEEQEDNDVEKENRGGGGGSDGGSGAKRRRRGREREVEEVEEEGGAYGDVDSVEEALSFITYHGYILSILPHLIHLFTHHKYQPSSTSAFTSTHKLTSTSTST